MSNQAGILNPRFKVMGMTGAVGQITWKQISQFVKASLLLAYLDVVRSYGVEKTSPPMASVS